MNKVNYPTKLSPLQEQRLPLYPAIYRFVMNDQKVPNPYKKKVDMSTASISSKSSLSRKIDNRELVVANIKQEKTKTSLRGPSRKHAIEKQKEDKRQISTDTTPSNMHIDLSILDSSDDLSIVGSSTGEVINEDCTIVSPPVTKKKNIEQSSSTTSSYPHHQA